MNATRTYPLLSTNFLAAYVITMRPYLLFVSGITGIAGMSLVPGVMPGPALLILFATFLSYGFGQALTDCFQIDTDTLSSPYRPLTQGTVTRQQVMIISIAGLTICVTLLALLNPWNLLLGMIAGGGLATYTPFKRRWWGGPWYNAWIVALLGFMAFLAANGNRPSALTPPLFTALCAIFFGYANFVLAGYFKDIDADRRSNYNTFPVVFGRKKGAIASTIFALLAIISVTAGRFSSRLPDSSLLERVISAAFLVGMIGSSSIAQFLLFRVRHDEESHAAIGLVVHAYILGLAALASQSRPDWGIPLSLFYAAFVIVLEARPARSQI